MTNQLLQSDIDLAKRLIQERHSDEEILAVLTRRRIDPQKAVELLAALRTGASVEPELRINYEVGEGFSDNPADASVAAQSETYAEPTRQRRNRSGKSGGWKLWLGLILTAILAGAALYIFMAKSGTQEGQVKTPEAPADASTPATTIPSTSLNPDSPQSTNTAGEAATPSPL